MHKKSHEQHWGEKTRTNNRAPGGTELRFVVRFRCKCWSDCRGLTEDEPLTQATGFPPHRPIQKHFV